MQVEKPIDKERSLQRFEQLKQYARNFVKAGNFEMARHKYL